ncbi:MAG: YfjI family protein [Ruminococcus sp.]
MQTEITLTAEQLELKTANLVENILLRSDLREREELYTGLMNQARELNIEQQVREIAQQTAIDFNEPELWELPEPFEKSVPLQPFPLSSLPPVLGEYLKAVAEYVQVFPEMAVLPLLSVLSLCVQGKAVVKYPGNNHTEPLNLYTMTIASPGERKSGCFKEFMKPVEAYQERYNTIHKAEIEQYRTEKAFLEQQKRAAMNGKNASVEKAKEITVQLLELEEKHELRLNVNDVTPEALAWEMFLQGGRIGVMDDEGSVFDVLSGLYSGGSTNINIFLKAYDGSNYTIIRRTREDIELKNPLLTMGIMTQPEHFSEAVSNRQFSGRGFIHRFLFSFPESRAGFQSFNSKSISTEIQGKYAELINRLLRKPYPDKLPVIGCDSEAYTLLSDYFNHIQEEMREGGVFGNLKEWASKQFARCLKVAGILHLCEHEPAEQINGQTAINAVSIAVWCENQALKAFSGAIADSHEVRDAKYILSKLKCINKDTVSKRELLRLCRALNADDAEEPLALLEDMNIIRRDIISSERQGRPKETIKINPIIIKSHKVP